MSDEVVHAPGFWQEGLDVEAATEREPRLQDARRLAPGAALSVLWWEEQEQPRRDESR